MKPDEVLFPFHKIRGEQEKLIEDVNSVLIEGKTLLAHAPTGIGKTAATLAPALKYALKNNKTIFFLTPKHSQHRIVVETLRKINERYNKNISIVDFVGKQWTCLYKDVRKLGSSEFNQFCQAHKRNETCRFYNNVYDTAGVELKKEAKQKIDEIKRRGALHSDEVLEACRDFEMCTYEVCVNLARSANVIICDYFHLFQPKIRKAFLGKLGKELKNSILIIDEAHNLPDRVRGLMSINLSDYVLGAAAKEARALHNTGLEEDILDIRKVLERLSKKIGNRQGFVKREEFSDAVEKLTQMNIVALYEDLESFSEVVLETPGRLRSFCFSVSSFLESWCQDRGETEVAFSRILSPNSHDPNHHTLSLKCLDPSIFTDEVLKSTHANILMSGTLLPLELYLDVLNLRDNSVSREYLNPFPPENKITLIVKGVTTKFSKRNRFMYMKIADNISKMLSATPGNAAVFFPSYKMMEELSGQIRTDKERLIESPEMGKDDRDALYERLVGISEGSSSAVLFGVQAGSFSEGVDFPGKVLDCVIVVGLPLEKPSLEIEALINYYDFKFGRGWDYGYTYPAMNRVLQASGRCIRSETDRGSIILMDDRFLWKNYKKCFPRDFRFILTEKPSMYLEKFFSEK